MENTYINIVVSKENKRMEPKLDGPQSWEALTEGYIKRELSALRICSSPAQISLSVKRNVSSLVEKVAMSGILLSVKTEISF